MGFHRSKLHFQNSSFSQLLCRYSIVVPRDKCAGDLGDQPGVRSYGMRPADERYDVYCYIEDLRGSIFLLMVL